MKIKAFFLLVALVAYSSFVSLSQDAKTYRHPTRDFSFEASGMWQENPMNQDKMIYELINVENEVHVMLWYNGGTESSCEHYLVKMAEMKGLECEEPVKKVIDDKVIWVLECTDAQQKIHEKRILAAMSYVKPYGKEAPERSQGKTYNAMHIAQVWCPAPRYEENKEMMDEIIASLELVEQ